MRNIKISVRRLSVRPDAVKFYETVFFICLSVFLIKAGYVLVKKSGAAFSCAKVIPKVAVCIHLKGRFK